MNEHTVKSFDAELEALDRQIAEMGDIAEHMLAKAMSALSARNGEFAQEVIAADARLDILQKSVERSAVRIVARRQPVAIDLRQIVSAIRISADLERIGDMSKNIAKRALKVGDALGVSEVMAGLKSMQDLASAQLAEVLGAYARRDIEGAEDVWRRDAELDALEETVFRDLLTHMMEDPRNITYCPHLLFCSKNLERVGDHTTNIAETIVYIVTGDSLPAERPRSR